MAEKCKHGKPPAMEADLLAWARRHDCTVAGDCRCTKCRRVCWDSDCAIMPGTPQENPP